MIIISIHRKSGNSDRFYFLALQNYCGWWLQPWNSKMLAPWKESNNKPRPSILKQRPYFAHKSPYSQSYGFSSSHLWMWELDHKEGWMLKNWCFRNVMLEKTLESPLYSNDIKPVKLKGNQPGIFIKRINAEAPIFWPSDENSQLIGKDSDAGKDQGQEQKVAAEDETVREHHHSKDMSLNKLWGDSEGQGILVCCSPCIANSQTLLSEWTSKK